MKTIKNKHGATFQIWIEIILFVALFLGIMAIITDNMNHDYNQNQDLTGGLNVSGEYSKLSEFAYKQAENSTTGGTMDVTDFGIIKLSTVPFILYTVSTVLWSFVNGSFINNLVALGNFGQLHGLIVATLQILFILGILFIFIRLVVRVNP